MCKVVGARLQIKMENGNVKVMKVWAGYSGAEMHWKVRTVLRQVAKHTMVGRDCCLVSWCGA